MIMHVLSYSKTECHFIIMTDPASSHQTEHGSGTDIDFECVQRIRCEMRPNLRNCTVHDQLRQIGSGSGHRLQRTRIYRFQRFIGEFSYQTQ